MDIELKNGTNLDLIKAIEKSYLKANGNPSAAKRYSDDAINWYRNYVPKAYNKVRTSQVFMDRSLWKNQIQMGKFYFFDYDALHKDTLDIWDAFPFTVFFDSYVSKEGKAIILGLNMHYLPPKLRMIAFKILLGYRSESRYRKSTKLELDWQKLKVLSQHKLFKAAIHAYRVDHVRSVFVEIPSSAWQHMIFLPVARWKKGNAQDAYAKIK